MDAILVQTDYLVCSVPTQLEHMSTQLTTSLFTLAESAAVDPAVVTDTVSAKNGGFFGPLASLFETFLKVKRQHSTLWYIWHPLGLLADSSFWHAAGARSRDKRCWRSILLWIRYHSAHNTGQAGHIPPVQTAGNLWLHASFFRLLVHTNFDRHKVQSVPI